MNVRERFRDMEIRPSTYFLLIFAACIGFGIIVPTILMDTFSSYFSGATKYLLYALPIFVIFVVAALPLISTGRVKREIEQNIPLFVTRMAALSTSELPVDKIFLILSEMKEYGRLADDSRKIYRLIKEFHLGAAEACRFIGSRTPSTMEADFLSRLSHALDVGEKLDRFLRNEQDVVMDDYILKYETTLKDMDFVKEIYMGIVTSLIFVAVFISIVPLMTSQSVELLTFAIVMTFGVMEGLFVYFMISKVPQGDTWYRLRDKRKSGYITKRDRTMMASVLVSVLGVCLLAMILLPLHLPISFVMSTVFLPILIPGFFIWSEEKRIERRDSVYSSFIRALGRSSDVSGQTMTEAVKKLSMHKFGPLTKLIDNLAKRLNTRINTHHAWRHFSSESSSNLINKFGEMYIHSTLNGAKPEPTSIFISTNMGRVLGVRKKRHVLASSFVGVLYGVMVSLSFTLWATLGIVQYISTMLGGLVADNPALVSGGFMGKVFSASFDIESLTLMVYAVILIHAFFSSIMLSVLRGGHTASAAIHFVVMIWIGTVSSFLVQVLMSGMLAGGGS